MKIVRTQQKIEGNQFHYILLNQFKIEGEHLIENIAQFSVEFLQSDSFLENYSIPKKDTDNYLPFCFNPKELDISDFNSLEGNVIDMLRERFTKENGTDSNLYSGFNELLKVLSTFLSELNLNSEYSFISSGDYPLESPKINNYYKNAGFFVTDYFFFGLISFTNQKEFLTFELGHE